MKFLKQIDHFLTERECIKMIEKGDELGWTSVDRVGVLCYHTEFNDPDLAHKLYQKLLKLNVFPSGLPIAGLNDTFHMSKYECGQHFFIHKDTIKQDKQGRRSVMTLNIFLNKDFTGGQTTFYDDNKQFRLSVEPDIGKAALFDSQQYHEGNEIKSGYKYLLRTDLMLKF